MQDFWSPSFLGSSSRLTHFLHCSARVQVPLEVSCLSVGSRLGFSCRLWLLNWIYSRAATENKVLVDFVNTAVCPGLMHCSSRYRIQLQGRDSQSVKGG